MNADQAKMVADTLLKVWEFEFPATCKVLANVKEDNRDYKPDPKSRTAFELAKHLATGDIWFLDSVIAGAFNYDPESAKKAESQLGTVNDVVEYYKREFPAKVKQLRSLPAEKLAQPVDFFGMMKWPNAEYLGFANNHSIHHRGQLAAYLRAMGSKVPAIYGGSADEPMTASV
jgi:uncharacterized damage-inducible protein DinB